MASRFDDETAVRRIGDDAYTATMAESWWVMRGPNGGYLAAVILRALTDAVGDAARSPRSLTVHYANCDSAYHGQFAGYWDFQCQQRVRDAHGDPPGDESQTALYWRDVGTLDSYYEANMDLCSVTPIFNLYDKSWPIRTRVRQYPPAKFVFGEPGRTGMAMNSIITAGVIVSGGTVSNSVLSQDVRVNSYTEIDASIIFSPVQIGRHCRIRRAIIDRDVHIPEGTVIGYDPVEDKRRYFVTPSGLTIVTRDASLFENPVEPEFGDRY